MKPRVFVVMPFGRRKIAAPDGRTASSRARTPEVDFDEIHDLLIQPALIASGCDPFRADQEVSAGDIRTDMFFELATADFVLADVSILNPNVFYELGVRHGLAKRGTLLIHGGFSQRPFDIAPDRTFSYDGSLFIARKDRPGQWRDEVNRAAADLSRKLKKAIDQDDQKVGSPVYKEVRGLVPADSSNIGTERAIFFGAQFDDWKRRIENAREGGRPGDILTLAWGAPNRMYNRRLRVQAGKALMGLNRFAAALRVFEDVLAEEPDMLVARCQKGLALARLDRKAEARTWMESVARDHPGVPETQGILGRVYKDLWRERFRPEESLDVRRQRALDHANLAKGAIQSYLRAFHASLGSYYTGINVVALHTLLRFLEDTAGRKPADWSVDDPSDLAGVVKIAAAVALEAAGKSTDHQEAAWAHATLGELALLSGDVDAAREHYLRAVATPATTYFQISSMLEQVLLFQCLGFRPEEAQAVAKVLEERRAELPHPVARFRKVCVFSGHMVDMPGRNPPRFPAEKEDAVRAKIAGHLERWKIGEGDLAVCGGARGGDIIFAEECLRRGAGIRLLIALPLPQFVRESVRLPKTRRWEEKLQDLQADPRCAAIFQHEALGPAPANVSVFERNNLWVLNTAHCEDPKEGTHALMVWDENPTGDGPGGTSHFAAESEHLFGPPAIVNPTGL